MTSTDVNKEIVAGSVGSPYTKISVVGLGYIGLPTAAMFASHGIEVVGLDVNPMVVDRINKGEIHIVEPDLDSVVREAVTSGYLRASMKAEAADAFLIAVPTPFKMTNKKPDLSYIRDAALAIAPVLKKGDLVVLESTSPVGTTEKLAAWLSEARPDLSFPETRGSGSDVRIAHCPERVLPGKVMQELISNDRLIGGLTEQCSDMALKLYKIFTRGECVVTSARTAELSKLTENSFRDVNIAFANELSVICDKLGVDVWEVITLANRHPRVNILRPGPGVGGHCIAVDPWFIVASAPEEARLIATARDVNDRKPDWVLRKVNAEIKSFLADHTCISVDELTMACYGITFKADIDDLRESPALQIVTQLSEMFSGKLLVVEPNIDELPSELGHLEKVSLSDALNAADLHLFLVGHSEFDLTQKPSGYYIDAAGVFERNTH